MAVIPSLRVNGVGIFPSGSDVYAGTGTAEAGVGGVLTVSTTSAQTGANTDETTLWEYALPANTLSANGYSVRVRAWGTYAANANSKSIRHYFGATQLHTVVTAGFNNVGWSVEAVITRTGASAQTALGRYHTNDGAAGSQRFGAVTTPAADTTGAITIKVTGQNSSASAGDIVFSGAMVEFLRAGS
jgi:hypothetical protein